MFQPPRKRRSAVKSFGSPSIASKRKLLTPPETLSTVAAPEEENRPTSFVHPGSPRHSIPPNRSKRQKKERTQKHDSAPVCAWPTTDEPEPRPKAQRLREEPTVQYTDAPEHLDSTVDIQSYAEPYIKPALASSVNGTVAAIHSLVQALHTDRVNVQATLHKLFGATSARSRPVDEDFRKDLKEKLRAIQGTRNSQLAKIYDRVQGMQADVSDAKYGIDVVSARQSRCEEKVTTELKPGNAQVAHDSADPDRKVGSFDLVAMQERMTALDGKVATIVSAELDKHLQRLCGDVSDLGEKIKGSQSSLSQLPIQVEESVIGKLAEMQLSNEDTYNRQLEDSLKQFISDAFSAFEEYMEQWKPSRHFSEALQTDLQREEGRTVPVSFLESLVSGFLNHTGVPTINWAHMFKPEPEIIIWFTDAQDRTVSPRFVPQTVQKEAVKTAREANAHGKRSDIGVCLRQKRKKAKTNHIHSNGSTIFACDDCMEKNRVCLRTSAVGFIARCRSGIPAAQWNT